MSTVLATDTVATVIHANHPEYNVAAGSKVKARLEWWSSDPLAVTVLFYRGDGDPISFTASVDVLRGSIPLDDQGAVVCVRHAFLTTVVSIRGGSPGEYVTLELPRWRIKNLLKGIDAKQPVAASVPEALDNFLEEVLSGGV